MRIEAHKRVLSEEEGAATASADIELNVAIRMTSAVVVAVVTS